MLYRTCKKCGQSYLGSHDCIMQIELPKPIIYVRPEPIAGPGTRSVEEYNQHNRPMNDRERGLVDQVMNQHRLWPQPMGR